MFYQSLRHYWLIILTTLAVLGSTWEVSARPIATSVLGLERIQSSVPVGLVMRLPREILLSELSDIEESKLIVRVFPSETPPSFTVSVFTCQANPYPCLLGSFSVDRSTSPSAKRELERHQTLGDRITLMPNIEGYLIEGPLQNPSYVFSTVMWRQNDMIYTISFPGIERQNILLMAASMARGKPIYPTNSRAVSFP